MDQSQLNWISGFIWGTADDVLRDLYVRGKYRDDSFDPGFETIILRDIREDEIQVVAELAEVLQTPTRALAATRDA